MGFLDNVLKMFGGAAAAEGGSSASALTGALQQGLGSMDQSQLQGIGTHLLQAFTNTQSFTGDGAAAATAAGTTRRQSIRFTRRDPLAARARAAAPGSRAKRRSGRDVEPAAFAAADADAGQHPRQGLTACARRLVAGYDSTSQRALGRPRKGTSPGSKKIAISRSALAGESLPCTKFRATVWP